ncbi:hypothetical protein BJ912DRAFT_679438 [Pholiota molesta]|nr:hypothetical protein BJ912DRAFT_679438 [Pholiota molesta]
MDWVTTTRRAADRPSRLGWLRGAGGRPMIRLDGLFCMVVFLSVLFFCTCYLLRLAEVVFHSFILAVVLSFFFFHFLSFTFFFAFTFFLCYKKHSLPVKCVSKMGVWDPQEGEEGGRWEAAAEEEESDRKKKNSRVES